MQATWNYFQVSFSGASRLPVKVLLTESDDLLQMYNSRYCSYLIRQNTTGGHGKKVDSY